jgi:hypothetical protein
MSTKRISTALLIALCVVSTSSPLFARGKKKASATEPGTYKEWKDEIDELEIVQSFKLSDYSRIVIAPLDTDETPLPEKGDNTYHPVKQVLADPDDAFIEGVRNEMEGSLKVEKGSKGGPGALLVRARIEEMDPGSQAARYFAGFGAGSARTKIVGEIIDGGTKEVLLRFEQERRSGVGVAGGDYVSLMNRNLEAVGEDLALIFNSF